MQHTGYWKMWWTTHDLGPYWVPIYILGSLFSVFWLLACEEYQFSLHVYISELTWFVCNNFLHCYYTCMLWSDASQVIQLANFVFFLCVKFHKSLFWVPILAAGGPYFTKSWVPIGSLFQSLGVLISFGDSAGARPNSKGAEAYQGAKT